MAVHLEHARQHGLVGGVDERPTAVHLVAVRSHGGDPVAVENDVDVLLDLVAGAVPQAPGVNHRATTGDIVLPPQMRRVLADAGPIEADGLEPAVVQVQQPLGVPAPRGGVGGLLGDLPGGARRGAVRADRDHPQDGLHDEGHPPAIG
jgi:hypothetical protein